jgi:hypothetical protein
MERPVFSPTAINDAKIRGEKNRGSGAPEPAGQVRFHNMVFLVLFKD